MTDADKTKPDNGPPPSEDTHPAQAAAERFAHLVGVLLQPIRDEISALRGDLGLTNGATRSVLHRVTDLEERVADLETRRQ